MQESLCQLCLSDSACYSTIVQTKHAAYDVHLMNLLHSFDILMTMVFFDCACLCKVFAGLKNQCSW